MTRAGDVLVLAYHGVSRDWPQPFAVTPDALEKQVRSLLARGSAGTTFADALREERRDRRFAVTFDDAYRSVLELALPILRRLGVPGTVFVPTDYADSAGLMDFGTLDRWLGTPWREEVRCMSWPELRRLRDAGWEIGSHTRTHPHLTGLADERLADELSGSKARCEQELDAPCLSCAYPFSDRDARVIEAVRSAGYLAAAADETPLTDAGNRHEWPRVSVYRSDGQLRFRLRASPTARAIRLRLRRARLA